MVSIAIRKEDKNRWEARAPFTPAQVGELISKGIDVYVESSGIRAFSDQEYEDFGAVITKNLDDCNIIFGIKEIPPRYFGLGKTLLCFSHTIKGQEHNMPTLWELIANQCNLIDYEVISNGEGKRLVFFGNYAGYAGMVDSLWALGKRLEYEGVTTPFASIKKTVDYNGMKEVRVALKKLAQDITQQGLPDEIKPLVVGFAGYGHVSRRARELLDILPHAEIEPEDIFTLNPEPDIIYKVVFREEHMVRPNRSGSPFVLNEYYDSPGKYHSVFSRYLPYMTVLMNCIFWDNQYPRLVTKDRLQQLYETDERKLKVIGDISCDVDGAVECNIHVTTPGEPVYTYDPLTGETRYGVHGEGPVILAVDNLPCELPKESTEEFGEQLIPFVQDIAGADYTVPFNELKLPEKIKKAVVVYQGALTPNYSYLESHLERGD